MPARMKANGNFSYAKIKRFYSVRINRMDLARPCNNLFEF